MDPMQQLARDAQTRASLDERLPRLCWEAWAAGSTWREVALAAGMTAPGARKAASRYRPVGDDRPAEPAAR